MRRAGPGRAVPSGRCARAAEGLERPVGHQRAAEAVEGRDDAAVVERPSPSHLEDEVAEA